MEINKIYKVEEEMCKMYYKKYTLSLFFFLLFIMHRLLEDIL